MKLAADILLGLAINPAYLLGFLVVMSGLFYWWFVVKRQVDEVGWKRADYLWLGVAAVGLLSGQVAQARQTWYQFDADRTEGAARAALSNVVRRVHGAEHSAWCDSPAQPTPPNHFASQQQQACKELRIVAEQVNNATTTEYIGHLPSIQLSRYTDPKSPRC